MKEEKGWKGEREKKKNQEKKNEKWEEKRNEKGEKEKEKNQHDVDYDGNSHECKLIETRMQVLELGPRDWSLLWSVLVCPGLSWSVGL